MTIADKLFYHVSCLRLCAPNSTPRRRHNRIIKAIVNQRLPAGSPAPDLGRPSHGTTIDFKDSNDEQLIFRTNIRHLDDGGRCLGWSAHKITLQKLLTERLVLHVESDFSDVEGNPTVTVREDFDHALRQPYRDQVRGRVLALPGRLRSLERSVSV